MGKNSLLFYPYGQLLLLMYDVKANKNSWTDSYSGIPHKYGDFIVAVAIEEVEDQNAIKIDDYGENIRSPPFLRRCRRAPRLKSFFGTFFLTTEVVKR